jgi:hypothetical protein
MTRTDIRQSRLLDVCGCFLRALRIVLDRDDAPPRLTSAEAEPDAAVAAGSTDLEHRLCAAGRNEHAQEPAVFLRHREQAFVGGLDALQNGFNLRCQRARRTLLCGGWSDEQREGDKRESERHCRRF